MHVKTQIFASLQTNGKLQIGFIQKVKFWAKVHIFVLFLSRLEGRGN